MMLEDEVNNTTSITTYNFGCPQEHWYIALIFGIVYLSVTVLMLIPYSICIHIIRKEKRIYEMAFRLIVLNMGYADFVQLVFVGLNPAVQCFLIKPIPQPINKFCGAMANFGWFTYASLAQIMAANRLISIYWPITSKRIFTKWTTWFMIAACWMMGFIWLVLLMLPDVNLIFDLKQFAMVYDYHYYGTSGPFFGFNAIINWVHASSIVILYIIIYIKVRIKMRKITNITIANEDCKERKVLVQSVVLCSIDVAAAILWVLGQLPVFKLSAPKLTEFFGSMSWLISAGGNSYLYLCINRVIRQKFKEIIHRIASKIGIQISQSAQDNSRLKPIIGQLVQKAANIMANFSEYVVV